MEEIEVSEITPKQQLLLMAKKYNLSYRTFKRRVINFIAVLNGGKAEDRDVNNCLQTIQQYPREFEFFMHGCNSMRTWELSKPAIIVRGTWDNLHLAKKPFLHLTYQAGNKELKRLSKKIPDQTFYLLALTAAADKGENISRAEVLHKLHTERNFVINNKVANEPGDSFEDM